MPNSTTRSVTALAAAIILPLILAAPSRVQAEPAPVDGLEELDPRLGFGARIGGYGFREPEGGATSWTDCRMDGGGLFGTVDVGRHFFGELALDFYQAHADVVEHGMDRLSMHTQVAAGLRMLPDFWVVPYIQIGGGVEWTRVHMMDSGQELVTWLPAGFLGAGGELNLLDDLKFGANIRLFAMALPRHEPGGHAGHHQALGQHGAANPSPSAPSPIELDFQAAGQAQFFIRYAL